MSLPPKYRNSSVVRVGTREEVGQHEPIATDSTCMRLVLLTRDRRTSSHGMGQPGGDDRARVAAPAPEENWFTQWSARTPLIARSLLIGIVGGTLIGYLTGISTWFTVVPDFVVTRFEIWRLVTYPFFSTSFLSFLFCLMAFGQSGPALEIRLGSAAFLVMIATLALLSAVVYILVAYVLMFNPILSVPSYVYTPVDGFWMILLALITIECNANPTGSRRLLCFPCLITNRLFPLAFIAFFGLMGGGVPFDLLSGYAVGALYSTGILDALKPGEQRLDRLEQGILASIARDPGFVTRAAAGEAPAFSMMAPAAGAALPAPGPASHPPGTTRASGGVHSIHSARSTPAPTSSSAGRPGMAAGTAAGSVGPAVFQGAGRSLGSAAAAAAEVPEHARAAPAASALASPSSSSSASARAAAAAAAASRLGLAPPARPSAPPAESEDDGVFGASGHGPTTKATTPARTSPARATTSSTTTTTTTTQRGRNDEERVNLLDDGNDSAV